MERERDLGPQERAALVKLVRSELRPGMPFAYDRQGGHAYYRRQMHGPTGGELGFLPLAVLERLAALGLIQLAGAVFFVTDKGDLAARRAMRG